MQDKPLDDQRFTFDKFMDDIVIKERKAVKSDELEETPQRRFAKKYRELPQNRTRVGSDK